MLQRINFLTKLNSLLAINPVVAILGPRQCGKTTLAKQYANEYSNVAIYTFDLENSFDLERLKDPILALTSLRGLIIIDEIQRRPELFQALRVLVDQNREYQSYLILGSASRELIQQSSETLAGRISYLELTPLQANEVFYDLTTLWYRGGFPRSFLAKDDLESYLWRDAYVRTFLEQDIPALGFKITANQLRRFWLMLTHYHGQIFNANELGRSLDTSHNTIKKYLDILAGTFMVRILQPWHSNLKKRQVKSPKIYFRDSGIYHLLNRIKNTQELQLYPKLGASWEGFALEAVIQCHSNIDEHDCYFWATQAGAELDLLIVDGDKRLGFEFKYTDTPKITKSMRIALADLQLNSITIISPGKHNVILGENIKAIGLDAFASQISLH